MKLGKKKLVFSLIAALDYSRKARAEFNLRNNFCEIHRLVERKEISRANALKGLNISVAIVDAISEKNRYFPIRVLDEVARRAKFKYTAFVTGEPNNDETWTDLLLRSTSLFDLAVNKWARNIERLDKGILYPESFYNADSILVMKQAPSQDNFSFWSFAAPFSSSLWALILVTIALTGAFYYLLEYMHFRKRKKNKDFSNSELMKDIYKSFHAFTATGNSSSFTPKSRATHLLTISMGFLYFILISAYTANLTNLYILKSQPGILITDIDDVIHQKMTICVPWGYASTEDLKNQYEEAMLIEIKAQDGGETETEKDVMRATSQGICDVGLVSVEAYGTYKRDVEYNTDCDLEWVGKRVILSEAGFGLADSEELCSSLLDNVIDYHLVQMKKEGVLDGIMEEFRQKATSGSCQSKKKNQEIKDPSVKILNIGGAFAFHVCVIAIAFLIGIYDYWRHPFEKNKDENNMNEMIDNASNSVKDSFTTNRTSVISFSADTTADVANLDTIENGKRIRRPQNYAYANNKLNQQMLEILTAMRDEKLEMQNTLNQQNDELIVIKSVLRTLEISDRSKRSLNMS